MRKNSGFQIEFQPAGKRIFVPAGMNVLEAARKSRIELASVCGGQGSCGQCRVVILEGKVSKPTLGEKSKLMEEANGCRLACLTRPLSDLKVDIPRSSFIAVPRLQIDSDLPEMDMDPIIRAFPVKLEPPDFGDLRADFDRLTDGLQNTYGLTDLSASINVIRQLSPKLREENWQTTAFVRGNEIVGIGKYRQSPIGFAVDLGTTKIASCLVDLATGQTLATKGALNPQIGYGEDVISRLNHALHNPDGGKTLAEKIRQKLDHLLGELLDEAKSSREQVVEACIVGNTAMSHLLLELSVSQLSRAPYVPAVMKATSVPTEKIGLQTAVGAYCYFPPVIGGFIGADHVAMVLVTGLNKSDKVTLGIDIGTNTEISLHIPERSYIASASCASGPAFEGAHIGDGMRAAAGAIEKVRITEAGIEIKTVGDCRPIGLCGSGIIDAAAELYRNGLINKHGRFQKNHSLVRTGKKGPEFVLVSSRKSGTGIKISIGQKDVNEIQLAKGAIHAGIHILLDLAGISADEVEEIIIAGAFGSFIDLDNAISIGLFPKFSHAHFRQVGNAALAGAKWMLISKDARKCASQIADKIQYQELTTYPKFSQQFALGMLFPQ